jgi:selenide,water dikinase
MTTGMKHGLLGRGAIGKVTRVMEALNGPASRAMMRVGANACTDVTGFGFLGHALEVAEASGVVLEIDFAEMPVLGEAYRMLEAEAVPGGLWANKDFVRPKVTCRNVDDSELNILCDPQTSGGLLISVPRAKTERLLGLLARSGVTGARVVGKVLAKGDGHIIVRK